MKRRETLSKWCATGQVKRGEDGQPAPPSVFAGMWCGTPRLMRKKGRVEKKQEDGK